MAFAARSTARIAVLLATLIALLSPAPASATEAGEIVAGLQRWLDGTRDLECRFTQRLVSGALGEAPEESGTLRIVRPGHMRWDYHEPEAKVALLEGDRTEVYLPADRQLVRGRLGPDRGLLGGILAGDRKVTELFEAAAVATGTGGSVQLRLTPRAASEDLEAVVLTLRPPTLAIEAADVFDAAGSHLEYRFTGLRRNRGIRVEAFRFTPPRGTEIIDAP
jgi:outer membrane lipoprotein carrier protein